MSDVPQRIGDAERDQAVQELQAHHAAGRLDLAEFDERMQRALQARTLADLAPLFTDLPRPDVPAQALAVPYASSAGQGSFGAGMSTMPAAPAKQPDSSTQRTAKMIAALMWPAALVINLAFGFEWWWLFLVPVFVMPVIMNALGIEKTTSRREVRGNRNSKEIQ